MENKILATLGIIFVIGIISMITVYAYKGEVNEKGPNYNEEVHEQMEAAIESGDYDAWIKIRQDNNLPMNGRMFQVINKNNFDKYSQMHEAMETGNYETANEIRTELGLGQGMKKGIKETGQGCGRMNSVSCQESCKNYPITN